MSWLTSPYSVALLAAVSVMLSGCGDEEIDRSCVADADCQVINTCCACTAINVGSEMDACETTCVVSGCHSEFGDDNPEAYCDNGTCQLRSSGHTGGGGQGGTDSSGGAGGNAGG